jgi:DNA polymerase III psi subunit
MSKEAYKYLFQQETLYRVPEPEPVVSIITSPEPEPAPVPTAEIIVEPQLEPAPVVAPIVTEPTPVVAETPQPVVPQINQKVLILVNDDLTPSEQILLENILKSVNLNLEGVDLLNLTGSGLINLRPVLASKRVHHFISFGVPFTEIRLNITLNRYDPKELAGITFMLADHLSAIEADRALKRQLWLSLQRIFQNA